MTTHHQRSDPAAVLVRVAAESARLTRLAQASEAAARIVEHRGDAGNAAQRRRDATVLRRGVDARRVAYGALLKDG